MHLLTEADVFALLTDVRRGLAQDGYLVDVALGERVTVDISARDDACEDCLVPKSVMRGIVVAALRDADETIVEDDVEINYPADSAG